MTLRDLADLPWSRRQLPGGGLNPRQVSPDPIHEAHPSWSFTTTEQVLTVGAIFHDSEQLRVTLGLALDVPYTPEVSHVVNRLNNKHLLFGRMFLIGNDDSGRGCILMQEIFCATASPRSTRPRSRISSG